MAHVRGKPRLALDALLHRIYHRVERRNEPVEFFVALRREAGVEGTAGECFCGLGHSGNGPQHASGRPRPQPGTDGDGTHGADEQRVAQQGERVLQSPVGEHLHVLRVHSRDRQSNGDVRLVALYEPLASTEPTIELRAQRHRYRFIGPDGSAEPRALEPHERERSRLGTKRRKQEVHIRIRCLQSFADDPRIGNGLAQGHLVSFDEQVLAHDGVRTSPHCSNEDACAERPCERDPGMQTERGTAPTSLR